MSSRGEWNKRARQWARSQQRKDKHMAHATEIRNRDTPWPVVVMRREWKNNQLARKPWCRWCGVKLDRQTATLDHITPLCQGGADAPENYALACYECNQARNRIDRLHMLTERHRRGDAKARRDAEPPPRRDQRPGAEQDG
jgi:5-methylcytosine-specific restriction endonuclease McrA